MLQGVSWLLQGSGRILSFPYHTHTSFPVWLKINQLFGSFCLGCCLRQNTELDGLFLWKRFMATVKYCKPGYGVHGGPFAHFRKHLKNMYLSLGVGESLPGSIHHIRPVLGMGFPIPGLRPQKPDSSLFNVLRQLTYCVVIQAWFCCESELMVGIQGGLVPCCARCAGQHLRSMLWCLECKLQPSPSMWRVSGGWCHQHWHSVGRGRILLGGAGLQHTSAWWGDLPSGWFWVLSVPFLPEELLIRSG